MGEMEAYSYHCRTLSSRIKPNTEINSMKTAEEINSIIAHSTGSLTKYLHMFGRRNRNMLFTEGVKDVADAAEAYWLIDAIFSYYAANQNFKRLLETNERLQGMSFWTLTVNADRSAVLTCVEDTDMKPVVKQQIEYTDFPLDEIKFYMEYDGSAYTLLLPGEH